MDNGMFENSDAPTVLLVENDRNGRRLLSEILTRMGFKIVATDDGRDALERCTQHPSSIDLLLTDLVIPGMNGVELSKRVRALQPGIKVLFISGFTEFAARQFGFELDGPLLEKPICATALKSAISEMLQVSRSVA